MKGKLRKLSVTVKPLGPEPERVHQCDRASVEGDWLVLDGAFHALRAVDWFRVTPLRVPLAQPDLIVRQAQEAANGPSAAAGGQGS